MATFDSLIQADCVKRLRTACRTLGLAVYAQMTEGEANDIFKAVTVSVANGAIFLGSGSGLLREGVVSGGIPDPLQELEKVAGIGQRVATEQLFDAEFTARKWKDA